MLIYVWLNLSFLFKIVWWFVVDISLIFLFLGFWVLFSIVWKVLIWVLSVFLDVIDCWELWGYILLKFLKFVCFLIMILLFIIILLFEFDLEGEGWGVLSVEVECLLVFIIGSCWWIVDNFVFLVGIFSICCCEFFVEVVVVCVFSIFWLVYFSFVCFLRIILLCWNILLEYCVLKRFLMVMFFLIYCCKLIV